MADLVADCADALDDARRRRVTIGRLTDDHPDLTLDEAYRVQEECRRRREAEGDRVIGRTVGLTTAAKQQQMKVEGPVCGQLFASSLLPAGEPVRTERFVRPQVVPEIVFLLGAELSGPGVHPAQVLAATRTVCGALSVLDPRYAEPPLTGADLVADNLSGAGVRLGSRMVDPTDLDLRLLGVMLEADGGFAASAAGAATAGHPAQAVADLANVLSERGEALPAGSLVFSGGLTDPVAVEAGQSVTATFAHLGSVTVRAV